MRGDQDEDAPPLVRRREGRSPTGGAAVAMRGRFLFPHGGPARDTTRPCLGGSVSGAVFEPPARVAGFHDIAVVRQAVEHGGRHFGVAEYRRAPPFLIG